ncbi:hypothetical protein HJG60_007761 [Phyllostomus discolor]|uniref:Uncharacterized protein n=1 Tax=Phyllostomus discolor TaxID=89673 RepID=A0A834BKG6_9CHIR|nr:hypothetical protein HJG60_007761 [Phyllostomus discolor]
MAQLSCSVGGGGGTFRLFLRLSLPVSQPQFFLVQKIYPSSWPPPLSWAHVTGCRHVCLNKHPSHQPAVPWQADFKHSAPKGGPGAGTPSTLPPVYLKHPLYASKKPEWLASLSMVTHRFVQTS